jgi:predicted MFS family arabinose efflux permease
LTLTHLGERCSRRDKASACAAYITGNVASNLFGRLIAAAFTDHFGLVANFALFAALNLAGAGLVLLTIDRTQAPAAGQTRSPFDALAAHLSDPSLRAAFAIGFCILFAFIGTFT